MKSMARIELLMFLLPAFLSSCTKTVKSREELLLFINNPENGLLKTEQIGEIKVQSGYLPYELMLNPGKIKDSVRDSTFEAYSGKYYFILSFSKHGNELLRQLDYNLYSDMVQVFSFRMSKFIYIIPDKSRPVKPRECLFQQTYGMSESNSIVLVFESAPLENADNLHLTVNEFGLGTGNISFDFRTKDITDIPHLTYKN